MRLVRWLFGLAVVATLLWGGYWYAGARALRSAIDELLADPGSPLSAAELAIAGFPNRFDVTLTEPRLALPGLDWSAPFVQAFALSYRPHHLILVFPPEQRLALPGAEWCLVAGDGRASAVLAPARRLELERLVVVLAEVALEGPARLNATALRLAMRPAGPARYEAVAEAETVFPDPALLDAQDPDRHWPRRFDVLRLDAELAFDRPLDLEAARHGRLPAPRVVLTAARAAWPGVDLEARGRIDLHAVGGPAGEITLAIRGWRDLVALLERSGSLSPELRRWIDDTALSLARTEDGAVVDVPLRIEGGRVRLGPLVLLDLAER
jgi:hypothetical protein